MIFDPTDLNQNIERYCPYPLPAGSIAWGKIQIDHHPDDGLLVELQSGGFAIFNGEWSQSLDHSAVLAAIRKAII